MTRPEIAIQINKSYTGYLAQTVPLKSAVVALQCLYPTLT